MMIPTSRARSVRALILAIVAASGASCAPFDPSGLHTDNIIGGVATFDRPEIGHLSANGRGCTATLVGTHVIITAAHCIHENWNQATFPLSGRLEGTFTIDTDATTSHSYALAQYQSYGRGAGADDISLVQLREDVPFAVAVPSMLATRGARTGDAITLFGYGCNALDPATGSGVKRKYSARLGGGNVGTSNLCPGDSGGPLMASGGIIRINSAITTRDTDNNTIGDVNTGDIYANPLLRLTEIGNQIRTFQTSAPLASCNAMTSLSACDASGCAWYACSNSCWNRGTNINVACPSQCNAFHNIPDCNAAGGCAWFACSNSCWGNQTPMTTACPSDCRAAGDITACTTTPGCAWYACSNSCWTNGTPVSTACPGTVSGSCASSGQSCAATSDCCSGLSCSSGRCTAPTPSTTTWNCADSSASGRQVWTCSGGNLHECSSGTPVQRTCDAGCVVRPVGSDDLCVSNDSAWDCTRSAYAGNQYWTCEGGALHRCSGSQATIVACPSGCASRPTGTDDICN